MPLMNDRNDELDPEAIEDDPGAEATGTPECRHSMDRFGEDWNGPYMGFDHVELVVEGHNQWDPMPPPFGQHYERWYYGDGLGDLKNKLFRENHGPDTKGAPQTWHSGLPVAWHNTTWVADRTIAYMNRASGSDQPFCAWASRAASAAGVARRWNTSGRWRQTILI